jgi:hypothetical protein
MKVDLSFSSTNFTLDGSDIHNEALPAVSAAVSSFSSTIQSLGRAIEDLNEDTKIEDGRRKTMMALILKVEILTENLSSQAAILEQLRSGTLSPVDAGFPEFDHLDY